MLFKKSILLLLASYLVQGDDQFKSRPDLTPPIWNISKNYISQNHKLQDDYIFVTPYANGEDPKTSVEQPGAYIYTNNGDLVWSGFSYFGGIALNFQANTINDENILYAFEGQFETKFGHGHGHIKILGEDYQVKKELRAGNHQFADIHEFHLVDNNKHGLLEIYSPISNYDLSPYNNGQSDRKWIVNAIVQEIDVETNKVLFEWKSLDHVDPSYSVLNLTSGQAGGGFSELTAWDYFHINSVDKNINGDYIISSRHSSTIYKINGKTGKIIWRLSSQGVSDLKDVGEEKLTFGYQHHARFISQLNDDEEIISFFDNNAYSHGHTEPESSNGDDISSAKIIKVNNKLKTVELLQKFNPPKEHLLSAKSQGSFQFLPNGNKLINWGSAGAITEHDTNGDVLLFAKLDSDLKGPFVQNYRAFKFPWVGKPVEDIAVYKETNGDDLDVFISWNGDTLTKNWEIHNAENGKILTTFAKQGFESKTTIKNFNGDIVINAIDSNGEVLKSFGTYNNIHKVDLSQQILSYFDWRS